MAESNLSLYTQNTSRNGNSLLKFAKQWSGTEYFVFASLLCVIMLLALFGNLTLIVTIYYRKNLRTRTNLFILNLACADLGVALFCIPFSIITCFSREWIFGNSLCQLNGFLNILFECSSLFTLTAISIEKYFSIVRPMDRHVITTRLAWMMMAMTWIAPLILASIPMTGFTAFKFKAGSTQCSVQVPSNLGQIVFAFVALLVAYLIPLCIMGFCYVNIFSAARKHDIRLSRMSLTSADSGRGLSSQKQVALTIFMMFITFIVCWTPYFAYMTYMTALQIETTVDASIQNFGLASYWCAFLNSCINPFLYGLRNPLIRQELNAKSCQRFQNCTPWHKATQQASTNHNYTQYCKTCLQHVNGAPHVAYRNSVALAEENKLSPDAGISIVTSEEFQMGYPVLQLLSIQDLRKDFASKQPCGGNQTMPRDLIALPTLFQDTNLDHTWNRSCSTHSSSETAHLHVMDRRNEVTCSNDDFSEDILCSDEESTASVNPMSRWSCEDGSYFSSCSSDSSGEI